MLGLFKRLRSRLPQPSHTESPTRDPYEVSQRDETLAGWRDEQTNELFEGVVIGADDVVIDVGCGTDPAVAGFCAARASRMILSDIDPTNPDVILRKLSEPIAKSIEVANGDGGPVPLPDGIATRVISTQVIEHVDDPDAFLADLVRLGRSGALYILAVPDPGCEYLVKQVAPGLIFEKPNHVRILERDAFAALVERAGLVIELRRYTGFYQALRWLIYWADWVDPQTHRSRALDGWSESWDRVLDSKDGLKLKHLLDKFLPKSQVIVARKP